MRPVWPGLSPDRPGNASHGNASHSNLELPLAFGCGLSQFRLEISLHVKLCRGDQEGRTVTDRMISINAIIILAVTNMSTRLTESGAVFMGSIEQTSGNQRARENIGAEKSVTS